MPAALALFAALLTFGPELAELMGLGNETAWQYVASGVESAVMWSIMGAVMARVDQAHLPARLRGMGRPALWACRWACWWMAVEGAGRAGFRLAFDMHHKPTLAPGQTLADAALGVPTGVVSFIGALVMVVLVQAASDARARRHAAR